MNDTLGHKNADGEELAARQLRQEIEKLLQWVDALPEIDRRPEAQILGYLKSARLEHGLLINIGSYKFEIREFAWTNNQPQRTQRTQSLFRLLFSALDAFFAVKWRR